MARWKEVLIVSHAHTVAIRGSHRPTAAQAKLLGKADDQQRIKVSIYVRPNPQPPATARSAVEGMNVELPARRKYLSDGDFNAVYGADPAELGKVAAWATQHRLTVVDRSIPKCRLQVEGTIGDVSARHLEPIGGTSAAAPLWAALIARLNQGLKARCGFLNQLLYTKFPTGVLHDITAGNNGAYAAGPGWDACTGLGSPDGQNLLKALSG